LDVSQQAPKCRPRPLCSSICICRSELWHQSRHAVPSCAQHFVQIASCLLGAPGPWEAHKLQFQWALIFSTRTFCLHLLFPFLFSWFLQDRPQEKPICIFISNLDQLRAASPPISPLLWEFMENVYPGGIGCIIKKGEWLKKLGETNRTALLSLFQHSRSAVHTPCWMSMGRDYVHFMVRNHLWSSYMPW